MGLSVICKQSAAKEQDRVKKLRTGPQDSQSGVGRIAAKNTVEGRRRKFQGNAFK
jgi:hypothetical protein